MDFYTKYLKYKSKYFQLKKQLGGGKPNITAKDNIKLCLDSEMDKLLNPIYGLIMCESGYITNNFYLNKIINTNESKIINKICKDIEETIQPTNNIMNLTPIDFGRYIAIKYINKKTKIIESIKDKVTFISKINNSKTDKEFLNNSISKLRSFIPINTLCDDVYFHLILYCFWWTANNKDGIATASVKPYILL
jgi:hypothetical protein